MNRSNLLCIEKAGHEHLNKDVLKVVIVSKISPLERNLHNDRYPHSKIVYTIIKSSCHQIQSKESQFAALEIRYRIIRTLIRHVQKDHESTVHQ